MMEMPRPGSGGVVNTSVQQAETAMKRSQIQV